MTETINQPKRGHGRPKKYFTDEERKQADKRYVKKCMENNPFHCGVCDRMYHMARKSKHLKSKKYIRNLEKNVGEL